MNNRLIFVSGGHRFISGHSGLALRTRLTFDLLGEAWHGKEKHLITAPCEELLEIATRNGWKVHFIKPYSEGSSAILRVMTRWVVFALAHFSKRAGYKAMTMLGGSDMPPEAVCNIINTLQPATVWLSRCDLLPIAGWVSTASSRIIVDTNDSVYNLVRCYRPRAKLCGLTGWTNRMMAKRIKVLELELAERCESVIAISIDDLNYFRSATIKKVELEESCIITPPLLRFDQNVNDFDIGYIGGPHLGSISAAVNLLKIASRPELNKIRFAIAGGVCESLSEYIRSNNVALVGRVADANHFLCRCRQVVLWSSGETGTSVKFQESILSGVTVLANAPAARWSAAVSGRDYLLCDNEDTLVRLILARSTLAPSPLRDVSIRETLVKRFSFLSCGGGI